MYKTKETVKKELRELFDIENNTDSYELNGRFRINKTQMERFEVIMKLQNYFNDISIEDGYVLIKSFTFVYTTFEIHDGDLS